MFRMVYKSTKFQDMKSISKIKMLMVALLLLMGNALGWSNEVVNGLYVSDIPGETFSENTVWYTVKNYKTGGTYYYLSTGAGYVDSPYVLRLSNSRRDLSDNGLWCIVSDGNGAYRFYNKGLGTGYVLSTSNSSRGAMVAAAGAKNTSFTFAQGKNSDNVSGWFVKDGKTGNNYWNQQGGYLAHWNSASAVGDNNSTFIFENAEGEETVFSEYAVVNGGERPEDLSPLSLWYDFAPTLTSSAHPWMEYGLPIGNGQIGATLMGGVLNDEMILNEKTLYNGSPTDYGDHGTYACLGKLVVTDLSEVASTRNDERPIENYTRYLDIEQGVGGVNYTSKGGTRYTRQYFTSAPHRVMAVRYHAEGSEPIHVRIAYEPDASINATGLTYSNAVAQFGGKLRTVSYDTQFRVVTADGTVATTEHGIEVSEATDVVVYLAIGTNFNDAKPSYISGTRNDVAARNRELIDSAVADGWNKVYADHVAQFTSLMGRVTLQLGDAASTMTTNQLIDNYAKAANRPKADGLFLEQLYFQYGRYLEISCNNILINAPSNLQGLWNDNSNTSFWHCDIHADVNVQMNYWPAEVTNLSTMHLPFLNNIITLSQDKYNYHRLAQRYKSGVRGWMLPTENNIFGGTSSWMAFQIKTMSAWNCSHLWQHYRYTLDRDFLCRALPAMLRAAQFLKDISTKAANGTYYVADEYSPEHGPSGHSTAFAQQNTAELVRSILEGVEVLGEESPIAQQDYQEMKDFYEVLDKGLHTETYNGNTCLREWADLTLNSQGDAASHRHLSHLMALFPYGQVSAYATDEEDKKMFKAAVNSLHVRNSTDVTGWSAGWKVNLHARALEGNRAHNIFPQMLRHSTSYVIQMSGQGGCYYNLWDSHSPFQIDGNFGYTSGVAEMLLQSYDGNLHLLPALPTVWKSGRVSGLKAVGDFTVDQEWADGVLTAATIVNNQGQPLTLTLGKLPVGKTVQATVNEVQVKVTENASGSFTIPTAAAGDVVRLTLVDREESGISPVSADDLQNERAYSLSGLPVNSSYHGLVVQKKKVMLKH